jgi:hypothetical protein
MAQEGRSGCPFASRIINLWTTNGGGFLDYLNDYKLIKKNSVSWSYLIEISRVRYYPTL